MSFAAACPTSPPPTTGCASDSDCGGDVCARDGECLPAADVRGVKVTWTVHGMAASAQTCASFPDLYLEFDSTTGPFGYAPVPCMEGQFNIDKIPTRFTKAGLGVQQQWIDFAPIDPATDTATIDLMPP